jgi:uncharacterized Zn-binding protein involved in type VI secretion
MTGVVRIGDSSAGHDGYPPTALVTTPQSTVFVNGQLAGVIGASYDTHTKRRAPTHFVGAERVITSGSDTVIIEGQGVARIGDSVADGDVAEGGSSDVIAG